MKTARLRGRAVAFGIRVRILQLLILSRANDLGPKDVAVMRMMMGDRSVHEAQRNRPVNAASIRVSVRRMHPNESEVIRFCRAHLRSQSHVNKFTML
jgi:hypothetical protein